MPFNISEQELFEALKKLNAERPHQPQDFETHPLVLRTIEILGFVDENRRLTPSGRAFLGAAPFGYDVKRTRERSRDLREDRN
jgi:hypothetical protein